MQRKELQRLVAELPEEQVPVVLADVRRRLLTVSAQAWPPEWFSAARDSEPDTAARVDNLLAEVPQTGAG